MSIGLTLGVLIIIGVVLVCFPTMDSTIRKLLIAVGAIVFVIWLIYFLGVDTQFHKTRL